MLNFEDQYQTLREFIDSALDGTVELQDIVFGFKGEEPVSQYLLKGAEEFIIEMDIDHIPDIVDPLLDNMIHHKKYWFFYEAMTKHELIDLNSLPQPINRPEV